DIEDAFKAKTSKKEAKEYEEKASALQEKMRKLLKKDKLNVKLEKLKNKKVSSILTVSEEGRRMQDMMKMYSMNGMGMDGMDPEETLVLNAGHPLVSYVLSHEDAEDAPLVCRQLYDLAKIANAPLSAEEMSSFIERSNQILERLFH
ncbi:MAG: molecular chaperone HtpG, partial [Lachnospiraceae bacterium]|nr:molecular chaperone HtpG [Lachnospiraceae bacterium]